MAQGEITELYDYRTLSIRDGIPTRTRGFRVEGLVPETAVLVPNLPRYGEAHPDDSTLAVKDITPNVWGTDSLVQVTYVQLQLLGGDRPAVNEYAEDFIGTDVSFDYDNVDIPLFKRGGLTTTDADGLPISRLVYQDYDRAIPYRKRMPYYSVSVSIELEQYATILDAFTVTDVVVAQTDKIHTIGGKRLLFACDGITQRSATQFKFSYRWTDDKGVPNTLANKFEDNPGDNLGRIGTVVYPFADADFTIPPFQGVRIDGNIDPFNPPSVTYFERFNEEPNGWQQLPGIA
jgi:hypothetical protein